MFIRFQMMTGLIHEEEVPEDFNLGMLQMAIKANQGYYTMNVMLPLHAMVCCVLLPGEMTRRPGGTEVAVQGAPPGSTRQ